MKTFMESLEIGKIIVKIIFIHSKLLKAEQTHFPDQSTDFAYFNYMVSLSLEYLCFQFNITARFESLQFLSETRYIVFQFVLILN